MKFVTALLMLIISSAPFASDVDSEALSKRLSWFLDGASANDAGVHDAFWADELVYTSSSGVRYGKTQLMEGVRQASEPDGTRYSATQVHWQKAGDAVVVTFRLIAESPNGEISHYLNTGVLRPSEKGWQAITWQATREAVDRNP